MPQACNHTLNLNPKSSILNLTTRRSSLEPVLFSTGASRILSDLRWAGRGSDYRHVRASRFLSGCGYVTAESLSESPHSTKCRALLPTLSFMDARLGGSWVGISGVISRVTVPITHMKGMITPLRETHRPPSRACEDFQR